MNVLLQVKTNQKKNEIVNIYIPNASVRAGCDKWLIFNHSLAGFKSEFFPP